MLWMASTAANRRLLMRVGRKAVTIGHPFLLIPNPTTNMFHFKTQRSHDDNSHSSHVERQHLNTRLAQHSLNHGSVLLSHGLAWSGSERVPACNVRYTGICHLVKIHHHAGAFDKWPRRVILDSENSFSISSCHRSCSYSRPLA